ncbi:thioredoxin family protein [Deinococcus koreensis]|uniref:Thioredoxin n=1 Tax=Deinococcus koreensis TaxID=2054903 RepID=A0A2K3URZ3_9DEIO|nr:thioredoxin family protein [Deinococcus koreensis]PNY79319.1 thioredoxin [Deinococcus koreensis]
MNEIEALTDASFSQRVEAGGNWVVYFWSADCRPCAVVEPVIRDLAQLHASILQVGSVDVDSELRTALSNRVMGVPTVILYKDGLPVEYLYSTYPPVVYHQKVEEHLLHP